MKAYLPKNQNEYDLDGKRFIETIRRCRCETRDGNVFTLCCKIRQRGEHTYVYTAGSDFISRVFNDGKRLYLSDAAQGAVSAAIDAYRKKPEAAQKWASVFVACGDSALRICYHRNVFGAFEYCLEYGETKTFYRGVDALGALLSDAERLFCSVERNNEVSLRYAAAETLRSNPVYIAAVAQEQDQFVKQLRRFYGVDPAVDRAGGSGDLGCCILPPLSEAFDRDYAVDRDTVDFRLLKRSGYRFLHRPYFCMEGSTLKRVSLNPHAKRCVDAAHAKEPPISFQDYLELFEKSKEDEHQPKEQGGST